MFDFYTKEDKYTVGEDFIMKNGEVIASGSVFNTQVLLEVPAILNVYETPYHSPAVIKTGSVISVLPVNEFHEGIQEPGKTPFHVSFRYGRKLSVQKVMAVNAAQAASLAKMRCAKSEILYITSINKGSVYHAN